MNTDPGYTVIAYFTRTFKTGALKGLTVPDSLRFTSRKSLAAWEGGVRANVAKNALEFTLSNVVVRPIAPIPFSDAARENMAECGIIDAEVQADIRNLATGDTSRQKLLARCLDGADADRAEGWRDYVSAIAEAAGV